MAEGSPSRERLVFIVLGMAALLALVVWVAGRAPRGEPETGDVKDRTWHFTSVRSQDDPANPSNALLLSTGDRLLAWTGQTDLPCYSFLQDGTKFEVTPASTQDFDNNGVMQELAGVMLGGGKGDVQLLVVCAEKPVEKLPIILATLNAFPLKPEARLEALLKTLQKQEGQGTVQINRSGWYKLNYTQPGAESGLVGAPALPPQAELGSGGAGEPGAQSGQEGAAVQGNRRLAAGASSGMGTDAVPAGGSEVPPTTPR